MGNKELTSKQKHILRLINKDAREGGWTKVSKMLFELVKELAPAELAEIERSSEDGGRARLTEKGRIVLEWC